MRRHSTRLANDASLSVVGPALLPKVAILATVAAGGVYVAKCPSCVATSLLPMALIGAAAFFFWKNGGGGGPPIRPA